LGPEVPFTEIVPSALNSPIGTSNSKRDAAKRIRHGMYTISNKLLQKSHRQLKTLCYTLGCFTSYREKLKVVKLQMLIAIFVPFGYMNKSEKY